MAADSHISDVHMEMKRRMYPRLQVVKKCGHYFTLDNTRLYMLRRMEEEGHCRVVPVDQVVLKKVPEAVQRMMIVPDDVIETHHRTGRKRFRLRRASEQPVYGNPLAVKDRRDTRSVTCSLETGRRKLPEKQVTLESSDESDDPWDESWPDETESLL